jgi:hypothetical protein
MPKQQERVALVRCRLSKGGFPTERIFEVQAPGGGSFLGAAPVEYCYGSDRTPQRAEIPRGEKIDGYIAGVTIGAGEQDGTVRVHLPDGDLYDLGEDQLLTGKDLAHVLFQP